MPIAKKFGLRITNNFFLPTAFHHEPARSQKSEGAFSREARAVHPALPAHPAQHRLLKIKAEEISLRVSFRASFQKESAKGLAHSKILREVSTAIFYA
jgi:hypothetical protein